MKDRHRDRETELTLEEFEANEAKEWHAGETDADFNLRDIKAMADVVMENTVPLDEFIREAEKRLNLR